jgi:hypothetical protein
MMAAETYYIAKGEQMCPDAALGVNSMEACKLAAQRMGLWPQKYAVNSTINHMKGCFLNMGRVVYVDSTSTVATQSGYDPVCMQATGYEEENLMAPFVRGATSCMNTKLEWLNRKMPYSDLSTPQACAQASASAYQLCNLKEFVFMKPKAGKHTSDMRGTQSCFCLRKGHTCTEKVTANPSYDVRIFKTKATCATYSCPSGWTLDATMMHETILSDMICCEAPKCDSYVCPAGLISDLSMLQSTVRTQVNCCTPDMTSHYREELPTSVGHAYLCNPYNDDMIDLATLMYQNSPHSPLACAQAASANTMCGRTFVHWTRDGSSDYKCTCLRSGKSCDPVNLTSTWWSAYGWNTKIYKLQGSCANMVCPEGTTKVATSPTLLDSFSEETCCKAQMTPTVSTRCNFIAQYPGAFIGALLVSFGAVSNVHCQDHCEMEPRCGWYRYSAPNCYIYNRRATLVAKFDTSRCYKPKAQTCDDHECPGGYMMVTTEMKRCTRHFSDPKLCVPSDELCCQAGSSNMLQAYYEITMFPDQALKTGMTTCMNDGSLKTVGHMDMVAKCAYQVSVDAECGAFQFICTQQEIVAKC